jgi:IclR family pca regulon transcriptional regulator
MAAGRRTNPTGEEPDDGKRRSRRARADGEKSAPGDRRSLVGSLAKGLRVLEAFTAERPELTLSEVAVLARIDPGTSFRMLNTLVRFGYVARVPESRRFRLTLKVTDLGFHAIGGADLREIGRPILRSLVGELNEAANLGVLDGADIVYIDRVRAGLTRVGVDIRTGMTLPAYCSAIGQAILAYLPEEEVKRRLAVAPRSNWIPTNPMTEDDIKRDLADVREHGFAMRDSYFGNGLHILSVPVLDIDKYPVASVSVAAPAALVPRSEFMRHSLEPVRRAAGDIARIIVTSGSIAAKE